MGQRGIEMRSTGRGFKNLVHFSLLMAFTILGTVRVKLTGHMMLMSPWSILAIRWLLQHPSQNQWLQPCRAVPGHFSSSSSKQMLHTSHTLDALHGNRAPVSLHFASPFLSTYCCVIKKQNTKNQFADILYLCISEVNSGTTQWEILIWQAHLHKMYFLLLTRLPRNISFFK